MILDTPELAVVESIAEALNAKRSRPFARFVSGGTELVADQNLGIVCPEGYISLRYVSEMTRVRVAEDRVEIGAGCTIAELLEEPLATALPLLAKAARAFGTRQVRNRGTIGGNIASGLPDRTLTPCLLVLDATVTLESGNGTRTVPVRELLVGPGITSIDPAELVTSVTIPRVAGFQDYRMVGPRNAQFYVTASIALVIDPSDRDVRVALGNCAPTAIRIPEAEAFALGAVDWDTSTLAESAAVEFGRLVGEYCDPPEDSAASAGYRRHAATVMARRLIRLGFESLSR